MSKSHVVLRLAQAPPPGTSQVQQASHGPQAPALAPLLPTAPSTQLCYGNTATGPGTHPTGHYIWGWNSRRPEVIFFCLSTFCKSLCKELALF